MSPKLLWSARLLNAISGPEAEHRDSTPWAGQRCKEGSIIAQFGLGEILAGRPHGGLQIRAFSAPVSLLQATGLRTFQECAGTWSGRAQKDKWCTLAKTVRRPVPGCASRTGSLTR